MLSSQELRDKFLNFFESKGHKRLPSASLVPENDSSVLFTTAGMHPLVPYLLGEKHPLGKRLCDVQKCLRTDDIDEVGDAQHCTFFEMLGYWSLGDYFKKESINYTFDFYTEVLGFNKDDISVTVFAGDDTAPFDRESYDTWKNEIGIPENRIYKYGRKENWWGPVGTTGPCGPDTEMFVDTGIDVCGPDCGPSCNCDKFVEIGNNVFMEFIKISDDKYEPLAQKNVDVGLGLERLAMFSQNKKDVFEIDTFEPIIKKIEELSGKKYQDNLREFRIIADHLRAAIFAIADGAIPSNKGAGYVVRRLIRRAVVKAKQLGINENFTAEISDVICHSEVIAVESKRSFASAQDDIKNELEKEETKFRKNIESGLAIIKSQKEFSGKVLFDLYQTHGIPVEITVEEAKNLNHSVSNLAIEQYNNLISEHQDLSRTASAGMFKGGLADDKIETTRLHTAAHLMLAAMRTVLGPDVNQKGSNITPERLRFDFNYPEKLTEAQIKHIESIVNENIAADLPVSMEEMTLAEAKEAGATGVFDNKYGDKVKVYTVGSDTPEDLGSCAIVSREICGGPHITHTGELGHFKITKEESSSAGIRRIKAVLE